MQKNLLKNTGKRIFNVSIKLIDPNLKSYTVDEAFEELEKCSPSLHSGEAHRRQQKQQQQNSGASEAHRFCSGGRGRDSAPSQKYSAPSQKVKKVKKVKKAKKSKAIKIYGVEGSR